MKTNIVFLMVFLCAFALDSVSQDIIYRKDGTKEEARVILIGEREVQYRKFDNPEGPVYSVDKSNILLITYESGDYEVIGKSAKPPAPVRKHDQSTEFAKNILSYHMFDVVFGDFTISYERLLNTGIVGIKVPFSMGYDYHFARKDFDYYYGDNRFYSKFYSGAGVNFYPMGQGKFRYLVGPHVRAGYGMKTYYEYSWYYDEWGNYYEEEKEIRNEGFYTQFFVDNGMIFTPIKNFSVSVIGSLGIRYFPEATYSYEALRPDGHFAINVSFRF